MKQTKSIFVIMPFRTTPSRNRDDLTAYFEHNIKHVIESCDDLPYAHVVRRSDDTFNITEQIIRDSYSADIVICDLSGHEANPNVMYELGVRLGISDKPVILIREQSPDNKPIFDIGGFYAFEYNPHQYTSMEKHLIEKIRKFETGEEKYTSPVLRVLETAPQVIRQMAQRRAESVLQGLSASFYALGLAAAGAVYIFVEDFGNIEFTGGADPSSMNASDMLQAMVDHQKDLKKLDWKKFQFHPTSPPALTAYLQEPPLRDFLPRPIEVAFNTLLLEYYRRYLATDYVWIRPRIQAPFDFIQDAILLDNASDVLLTALLASEEPEMQEQALEMFRQLVGSTSLVSTETTEALIQKTESGKTAKEKKTGDRGQETEDRRQGMRGKGKRV